MGHLLLQELRFIHILGVAVDALDGLRNMAQVVGNRCLPRLIQAALLQALWHGIFRAVPSVSGRELPAPSHRRACSQRPDEAVRWVERSEAQRKDWRLDALGLCGSRWFGTPSPQGALHRAPNLLIRLDGV